MYICKVNANKLPDSLLKRMDNVRYNRIKAVLAEQDKTDTWLSEQMGRNLGVDNN